MKSTSGKRGKKQALSFAPTTPDGTPGLTDGTIKIEVLSGAGTFETDPVTGNPSFIVSEDVAGTTRYRVFADADLSSGVEEISEEIEYTYTDPNVSNLGLGIGVDVDK